MTAFAGWENFYVIVGSSAGALIGLQFVVITLIADMPLARGEAQAGGAFATPSVVHFGVVLLLSAIVSAPWSGIAIVAALWGLVGVCGIVYTVIVARRLRVQTIYKPVFEDWLFHILLPFAAYATMGASAAGGLPRAGTWFSMVSGSPKTSSTVVPSTSAMARAAFTLGTWRPVSTALISGRESWLARASSVCVNPSALRRSATEFLTSQILPAC